MVFRETVALGPNSAAAAALVAAAVVVVLLVGIYFFAKAAFLLGWWLVIDPLLPPSALPRLLGIYLAGYTVNYVAPGGVAGEPLKAQVQRGVDELRKAN